MDDERIRRIASPFGFLSREWVRKESGVSIDYFFTRIKKKAKVENPLPR